METIGGRLYIILLFFLPMEKYSLYIIKRCCLLTIYLMNTGILNPIASIILWNIRVRKLPLPFVKIYGMNNLQQMNSAKINFIRFLLWNNIPDSILTC